MGMFVDRRRFGELLSEADWGGILCWISITVFEGSKFY